MFGAEMRAHDARYEYAPGVADAIKQCWSDGEQFDFPGRFIRLQQVRAKPKPFGGGGRS